MYIDLHCHILYDTDDGPTDKNDMQRMLCAAYDDGIREICVTPHFNHSFYGDNKASADRSFTELVELAREQYPDLKLYRGNEIFYHFSCTEHLDHGNCHTINGTKYILVDFSHLENKYNIFSALKTLVSKGYVPILAHTERYYDLKPFKPDYAYIKDIGALIQVNAASVTGKNGFLQKWKSRHMIKHGTCDVIASDAHNTNTRATCINDAAKYVSARYGKALMQALTYTNPKNILNGKQIIKRA